MSEKNNKSSGLKTIYNYIFSFLGDDDASQPERGWGRGRGAPRQDGPLPDGPGRDPQPTGVRGQRPRDGIKLQPGHHQGFTKKVLKNISLYF